MAVADFSECVGELRPHVCRPIFADRAAEFTLCL